jgi:hypothetical protein
MLLSYQLVPGTQGKREQVKIPSWTDADEVREGHPAVTTSFSF